MSNTPNHGLKNWDAKTEHPMMDEFNANFKKIDSALGDFTQLPTTEKTNLAGSVAEIGNGLKATEDGASGADYIGATPVLTGGGNTVQSNMEAIYSAVKETALGQIPNDSLTETKMATDMKKGVAGGVASQNDLTTLQNQTAAHMADIVYMKPSGGDDTATIQAKLTSITDGKTLRFLAGTYTLSGANAITCTKNINIECEEGVVFDATAMTSAGIFSFNGSCGTFYNLGADAALGAVSITVDATLAATLSQGDLLFLSTDTARGGNGELWNAAKSYYWKGEITKVESVSGTTVKLSAPLYDNYLQFDVDDGITPETMVCKLNPITVSIQGMTIKCTTASNQKGIYIMYGENCDVRNARVNGASNSCIEVCYVYNFTVKNCRCEDYFYAASGYGICVSSSQKGVIADNYCVGGRHGVTHGGYEPCRNIDVIHNTCYTFSTDVNAGIDVHPNAEFILIDGNTASGIWASGRNVKIINNAIRQYGAVTDGGINFYVSKDCEYIIINNNTITTDKTAGAINGIRISNSLLDNITINKVIITNNVIHTVTSGIIMDVSKEGSVLNSINISNNEIYTIVGTGIVFYESAAVLITHAIAHNIRLLNNYASCPYSCVSISHVNSATVEIVKMCHNIFEVRTAVYAPLTVKNAENIEAVGNHLACTAGSAGLYNILNASKIATIKENTFSNFSYSGVGGTIVEAIIADNEYENTAIDNSKIIGGIILSEITSSGNYITYGTSAPTAATWKVGDRCINIAPAVGQPKAWVCTVAGTPGTWVSEGNL